MNRLLMTAAASVLLMSAGAIAQTDQTPTGSGGTLDSGAAAQTDTTPVQQTAPTEPAQDSSEPCQPGVPPCPPAGSAPDAAVEGQAGTSADGNSSAGQVEGAGSAETEAETDAGTGQAGTEPEDADKPEQDAAAPADVEITAEQQSAIRERIVTEKVERVDIDIDINIGISVPRHVVLHPLPPTIIEIVPAYASYRYIILVDGTILIIRPADYVVVYVIYA